MKKNIKYSVYIFIIYLIFTNSVSAATRKSTGSGDWNNPATWNASGVPACGDSVVIQVGHIISVTNQQNYSNCLNPIKIVVYGDLRFFNGSKLNLPCGSYVIVLQGGIVRADVGLSNSNFIEICNTVEWNSNSILTGVACLPDNVPFCLTFLPVELISFLAESCELNKICFNWVSATEINNNHYEVERSSNAFDYRMIYATESKAPNGNSHYTLLYSGADNSPLNGISYYRLKQVDNDFTSTYSKVISVHLALEQGIKFLVFPNPNSGEFTVQITGLKSDENVSVFLRDAEGAIVYKALHHVDANSSLLNVVSPYKLTNGSYFCTFIIYNTEYIVRIIVDDH